jgi:hypothetical protein
MFNGPATKDWYARPGRWTTYGIESIGGGVFLFDFWNEASNVVYQFGFAGAGLSSTFLSKVGKSYGEWKALSPLVPFAPEHLHEAVGRMVQLKVSILISEFTISAKKKGKQLFQGNKLLVFSDPGFAGLFSRRLNYLVGSWYLIDSWDQKETMTDDHSWENQLPQGDAMPPSKESR